MTRLRRWPRIPAAWTDWVFAGRFYHRTPDGRVLVRQSRRDAWKRSVWPRG